MLVKPPTGPTEGSATLPEDEIARAGGSSIKGKPVLPEQAIARDASGGDQINEGGAGRAAKTNGVNGARPSGEPGYRKGPQPGPNRPRGGRPKGGR